MTMSSPASAAHSTTVKIAATETTCSAPEKWPLEKLLGLLILAWTIVEHPQAFKVERKVTLTTG
jgi:hypothetical protein